MSIRTHESVSGFIASDPQLTPTSTGDYRFFARIGQENGRREPDGTYAKLEPNFSDLVIFGRAAESAFARFKKGDSFIAEGAVRTYARPVDGVMQEREQFLVKKIGHDSHRSTYNVARRQVEPLNVEQIMTGPQVQDAGPSRDSEVAALTQREAELEPEPASTTAQEAEPAALTR